MLRLTTLAIPALVAALMLAGCNSQDAANLSNDTKNLATHAGQAIGSGTLAAKVNGVLAVRKGVDMSGLHVDAQDGVVTVGGHVRDEKERQTVVDTIDGIRGVDKVVDNIRIGASPKDTSASDKGQ